MQEKELRLAVVCFGGISLAIYIHGVTKEILKLARASRALHGDPDVHSESRTTYTYPNEKMTDVPDTELVYFDILKSFSPDLDLRVIVDTVSGASAGGMNGIILGRALAHDLNFDHLRKHWLKESDVTRLGGNRKPAGRLDKMLTKPLINMMTNRFLGEGRLGDNVKNKLPALLNIWNMRPLFDGKHLLGLLHDGLEGMGKAGRASLLPQGHRLEVFVTLTDYFGFRRDIALDDPAIISEREHRHKLCFNYIKNINDDGQHTVKTDFGDLDLPGLSFAARATACFPGAFPPAQLREVDSFLRDRGESWLKRDKFIEANFAEYLQAGLDPTQASFLDGSILNDKPFDQAIHAVQNRPAFRKVNRRIVYIDPAPEIHKEQTSAAPPSLANTIKAALSDIPMNQPMHDDLRNIQLYNEQTRTIRAVVDSIKPGVEKMVADISKNKLDVTEAGEIRYWRRLANARAVQEAGFAYEGYARLRLRNTIASMTKLIADICQKPPGSAERRQIFSIIQAWVTQEEVSPSQLYEFNKQEDSPGLNILQWAKEMLGQDVKKLTLPRWANFLHNFDMDYQRRRIQFLIRELNTQYTSHGDDARHLDDLKTRFYHMLERFRTFELTQIMSRDCQGRIRQVFLELLEQPFTDNIDHTEAQRLLKPQIKQLHDVFETITDAVNLEETRHTADQLIGEQNHAAWHKTVGHELMVSYLGFAYWDVITLSIMGARELGEFNEILVNRISPDDPSVLRETSDELPLKGIAMRNFGAFFSQADRENDYLWGRLNGAERLIDILYNQAKIEKLEHKMDVLALKKRAFQTILNVESQYLEEVPDLFVNIQACLDRM